MKLKSIFSAVLLMLCISGFASAGDFSKTFVDNEFGYLIKYPADWNAQINRSGMVLADINSNDKKSGLQIRITNTIRPEDVFVENYIQKFIRDMNAMVVAHESIKIDGINSHAISFQSNRSGKDYLLRSYIIPVYEPSNIYIFQAGALYDDRFEIVPVLDQIAESFTLK